MSDNLEHHSVHADSAVNTDSVTAVFVTFNSRKVIAEALQAVNACSSITNAIVVDNASTDGTPQFIESEFPKVQLVKNRQNIGFGRGNNVGLELVDTKFAFVLNPDTLPRETAVQTLLDTANRRPDAAIIGPCLSEAQASHVIRTGDVWTMKKTQIPMNTEVEVDFLSGAAMFMRMSHFRKIGFFDPEIFLFYEDDAICMKARNAGHTLLYSSYAIVPHAKGLSTPPCVELKGLKQCHFVWSRLYLEQKERGQAAAVQLAHQMHRSLKAKKLLARFLRNNVKQQLIGSRMLGVRRFLENRLPPIEVSSFTELNPDSDPRNEISGEILKAG